MNHGEADPGLEDFYDGVFWQQDSDISVLTPAATKLMEDLKTSIVYSPTTVETYYTEHELLDQISNLDEISCRTILQHLEYFFDIPKFTINSVMLSLLDDDMGDHVEHDLSDSEEDIENDIPNDINNDIEHIAPVSIDSGYDDVYSDEDFEEDASSLNASLWTDDELEDVHSSSSGGEESGIDDIGV